MSTEEQEQMVEDAVEDVDRSDNFFIRAGERIWSHIWFLLILSGLGAIGYVIYGMIQDGSIATDLTVTADVALGGPLKVLVYGLVAFLLFYTYSRYVYLNGEEHTEGLMKKVARGASVAMDNYSREDVQNALEDEEE